MLIDTRDEDLAKVEIGILGTIFAVALLGNVAVLSVLLWRRKKVWLPLIAENANPLGKKEKSQIRFLQKPNTKL
jgi:hypothetical protein